MILRSKTRNLRHRNHLHHLFIANGQNIFQKNVGVVPMPLRDPNGFKLEYPADNRNDGQDQVNLTHPGPSSVLKNSFN